MKGGRSKQNWNAGRIRALRKHMKLTQVEMAEQLGTRQQTISEWEKGQYEPRGASSKLLSIIAERSSFKYKAGP
ncbi:MAG: helix-turn-helix domain-containing protein [Dehalococcoidia bacterium]|nr:helix-turn-helix domain-containing protein [Dehalococcoidia bacterium]MDD5494020.1 helix-turn-helix domain-containing protein [Dehalococcoidia bacterium]